MRWILLALSCLIITILAYFWVTDSNRATARIETALSTPTRPIGQAKLHTISPSGFNSLELLGTLTPSPTAHLDAQPFNPLEWPTVTPGNADGQTISALATIVPLLGSAVPPSGFAGSIAPQPPAHPFVETLREIKQIENQNPNNLLPGIVRRGQATLNGEGSGDAPVDTPMPIATPNTRLSGQARGYTMLYLMHPKARTTVEKQVQAMLQSELNDLYLGVLVDGTFGKDYVYLADVVRRLASDGRSLTLVLYFSNGPGMRRSEKASYSPAGFNLLTPEDFRYQIQRDPSTRSKFTEIMRESKPVFLLNLALNVNNRNFAIPMLEDNLDRESFKAIKELADAELNDVAEIMRNPCLGCYRGNDAETFGIGSESHSPYEIAKLGIRDGFSLDGYGYRFPEEAPGKPLDLETVKQYLQQSLTNGVMYFGLWRADRQGTTMNGKLPPPDERTYAVPSDWQIAVEIELLRHGLTG